MHLRRIVHTVVTNHRQTRVLICSRKKLIAQLHHLGMTSAFFVLNIEIKAVCDAQFRHCWQWEKEAAGILEFRRHHECAHRASLNSKYALIVIGSSTPVLELNEAQGHVLSGTCEREPAHGEERIYIAGLRFFQEFLDTSHFVIRTFHRRALRQLHLHQRYTLILTRHEGRWSFHEAPNHAPHNECITDDEQQRMMNKSAYTVAHCKSKRFKAAVKPSKEPTFAHMLIMVNGLQDLGAKRRRQCQCNDDGKHHCRNNGDRELPINHAGRSAKEGHRDKHS